MFSDVDALEEEAWVFPQEESPKVAAPMAVAPAMASNALREIDALIFAPQVLYPQSSDVRYHSNEVAGRLLAPRASRQRRHS